MKGSVVVLILFAAAVAAVLLFAGSWFSAVQRLESACAEFCANEGFERGSALHLPNKCTCSTTYVEVRELPQ